ATNFNVYQSAGANPFALATNVTGTAAFVSGVSTSIVTRFYVTAKNPKGESLPSNTVTNFPTAPVPPGAIVLSAPALTATNLVPGQTVTGTATVANNRTAPLVIVEGWLTAREPGASNLSG